MKSFLEEEDSFTSIINIAEKLYNCGLKNTPIERGDLIIASTLLIVAIMEKMDIDMSSEEMATLGIERIINLVKEFAENGYKEKD